MKAAMFYLSFLNPVSFLVCILIAPELYGDNRTRVKLGFAFEPELNRTFGASVGFSGFGSLTLNTRFAMKGEGGISLGTTGTAYDIKTFAKAEMGFPFRVPLSASFHYIYNGLPAYKTHIQSLIPMVSLNGRWAGFSIGPAWHFTAFNREELIVESVLAFSGYVNFYNTGKARIGLQCANITNFVSRNMGAYSLKLYSQADIIRGCSLINEITLYQSGSVGLAAVFYGAAYRGGIIFTW
ncbi:MAG: hypothetical protein LBD55_06285 [Treponema sp.]|jgi:hypothetical protein|nr:hypothetical protein [Treponema sp.]